jgi:hypothetical protein
MNNARRFKFTKSALIALEVPQHGKRPAVYDNEIPKLVLRYTSPGSKTLKLQGGSERYI